MQPVILKFHDVFTPNFDFVSAQFACHSRFNTVSMYCGSPSFHSNASS